MVVEEGAHGFRLRFIELTAHERMEESRSHDDDFHFTTPRLMAAHLAHDPGHADWRTRGATDTGDGTTCGTIPERARRARLTRSRIVSTPTAVILPAAS